MDLLSIFEMLILKCGGDVLMLELVEELHQEEGELELVLRLVEEVLDPSVLNAHLD